MNRTLLATDVESRESLVTAVRGKERDEWLFRSLFSVLRRGEIREGEQEELKRREEEVEDRLEGWREGQEEGCVAKLSNAEQG